MISLSTMNFDASKVEPSTGFQPLPDGTYTVMVRKAEEKTTKSGTGSQLVLELVVTEGPCAKRTLFARINLSNPSEKAVEIGRAELSGLCRATGVMTPKTASEFTSRFMKIRVKVVARSDGNGMENKIAEYIAATVSASAPALVTASPSAPVSAPWGRA